MSELAKVFAPNPKGLNVRRALTMAALMVITVIVMIAMDQEIYILSVVFAMVFAGLSDIGGEHRSRVVRLAEFGLIGAAFNAAGFAIGDKAWGLVTAAAFVVTLLSGLAVKFGAHRFVSGVLINSWFLVALGLSSAYQVDKITINSWAQGLAWLIGSALWIGFVTIQWLARGRKPQPALLPELPGDMSTIKLTKPIILYAVIRAVAIAITVAIAFGLHLPNAYWMPIAALVAMKPSLAQSEVVGLQRIAGALIGALLAAIFLLSVHNKHVLEVVVVLFGALGGAVRMVNYAFYCAAIAACVLIASDLPHPTNFGAEGRRVLFTLAGVGIGVIVMFLADLVQKRAARKATLKAVS